MDAIVRKQIIEKAFAHWTSGQPLDAGRLIFESIPVSRRHSWAYEILKLASTRFPVDARIDAILEFASHPENWGKGRNGRYRDAHRLVDKVNNRFESSLIFQLATQVGKIVYTSQQYPAPFDHSAGWEIANVIWQIVQQLNDPAFKAEAWSKFADEMYLVLEEPVMCHPGCPICRVNGVIFVGGLGNTAQ
jgi:hypothetical protein